MMPGSNISATKIFSLWWPLAASSLLMSAEMPFVNAGIARTSNPEAALAGFGLATSLAILSEAPMLMLNGTTAALAKDKATFKLIERFTIHLGIFVTFTHFLLSFTPLYDVVLRQWMGAPDAVADACLPALRILLFWPAPIGWRRFHQGVLIRLRRTRLISLGTVVRLAITIMLTLVTIFVLRLPGQAAGAASVVMAVISESALISFMARRLVQSDFPDDAHEPALAYAQLFHFYLPLVMVAAMSILAQPILSTGLSHAAFPTESLAVWPTVWGLTMLMCSLCQPIQETTIALAERHDSLAALRRFGLGVGLVTSALLALIAFTPLGDYYFGQVIGLSANLRAFADPALMLLSAYPGLVAIELMLRGFLIRQQRTGAARRAMACFVFTLAVALMAGVSLNVGTGVQVAAVAMNLAIVSEIAMLAWQALFIVRRLRQAIAFTT